MRLGRTRTSSSWMNWPEAWCDRATAWLGHQGVPLGPVAGTAWSGLAPKAPPMGGAFGSQDL